MSGVGCKGGVSLLCSVWGFLNAFVFLLFLLFYCTDRFEVVLTVMSLGSEFVPLFPDYLYLLIYSLIRSSVVPIRG